MLLFWYRATLSKYFSYSKMLSPLEYYKILSKNPGKLFIPKEEPYKILSKVWSLNFLYFYKKIVLNSSSSF